ncbi:MAG: DNA mismatch repair endonuclease MutL [Endomicrobiia bacterium]|nr:DNA mismatch repair endonuclease MutL [Endomicrobiia bacterium]
MSKSEVLPSIIRILDKNTQERISAGEVVERPSSVVKELVENSLDAGARNVTVEIESAGRKLIRVADDGRGISASDISKVFLRHATSKIISYDDLFRLSTMGFRGEALFSISAVSEISVESAPAFPDGRRLPGAAIKSSYSEVSGPSPSSIAAGTIVEVVGLFANTPARLKFLKSSSTENSACIAAVQSLALANPATAFHMFSEGKKIFSLASARSTDERLAAVLKKDVFDRTVSFQAAHGEISVKGRVSEIDAFVASRSLQWVFANRRVVSSRAVSSAIYDAAREFMPRARHPVFTVFVEAPPSTIDANVSPTKREVKFADEAAVFSVVRSAVKSAFSSSGPVRYGFARGGGAFAISSDKRVAAYDAGVSSSGIRRREGDELSSGFFTSELANSRVKYIAGIFGYCLVAADEDNLYLIDAHAASERVLYEKYRIRETGAATQLLLAPVIVDLPPSVFADVSASLKALKSLGWKIEPFGESALKCEGTPAVLQDVNARAVLMAIFGAASVEPKSAPRASAITEEDIIKRSCREAIRGKEMPGFIEAQRLVNDLFSTQNYQTCPHGRPTLIKISSSELASKFRRT